MKKVSKYRSRSKWIKEHLGMGNNALAILVEQRVYEVMQRDCSEFDGGAFQFVDDSTEEGVDVHYMRLVAPQDKKFHVVCETNFYDGELSAEAFSIAVMTVVMNELCWIAYESNQQELSRKYGDAYHLLRDYGLEHPEAAAISGYLD